MSIGANSTRRASDSASYVYDKAGNPTSRKELGITSAYSFNNLNQFTSGSWTGALTVIGEVNYAAGTVTVNGVTGKIFPDRVFEATNITVSAGTNTLTAVYHGPAFTNTQMVATNTSTVVMATPVFGYDAKGNLTNDAEYVYQYDIANRLTNVISKASGSSVLAARYDGLGRRVEVTRNGSTVERYVYFPGSFLVLAVLDGANAVKEIYTHGPDLSGVVGGAGGIGGILSVSTNIGAAAASKYFHADAMGNVILISDSEGKQVTSYGFTPFGKLVNQVGDFKARFLFSSKEFDPETGLTLFGYRYLNTTRGAWLTKDPAGELGGLHLYRFAFNSPNLFIDTDGRICLIPGLQKYEGPHWYDHLTPWLGGISRQEVDNNVFFEQSYPGWVSHAKSMALRTVESALKGKMLEYCTKGSGYAEIPVFYLEDVYPYYGNPGSFKGGFPRSYDPYENETSHGDKSQGRWSADRVLGGFNFQLQATLVTFYREQNQLIYSFRAPLVVSDGLGLQSHDPALEKSKSSVLQRVFPDRGVIRARWTLVGDGRVDCCERK